MVTRSRRKILSSLLVKKPIFESRSVYTKLKEQPFADYVLTCPKITVKHFEVLNDEVSDHAPFLLEFE